MAHWIKIAIKVIVRLPSASAIGLVSLYQIILSPVKHTLFGPYAACRFQPTCSSYACECFREHGFWVGGYYSLRRILRCHPFNQGGFDPPPATGRSQSISQSLSGKIQHNEGRLIQKGELPNG